MPTLNLLFIIAISHFSSDSSPMCYHFKNKPNTCIIKPKIRKINPQNFMTTDSETYSCVSCGSFEPQ